MNSAAAPPDVLERRVEELSGQLVNLAQRARQQQELLDKIWEKVNTPPPPDCHPGPAQDQGSHPPISCPSRVQGGRHAGCARTGTTPPAPPTTAAVPPPGNS